MPQHDLDIANAAGNVVRADINAALVALGTNQRGPTAPAGPAAGWVWIDDNTPSATLWTVSIYDGAAWAIMGYLDVTNDRYWSAGAPIWGGTAAGTATALTITTTPPAPRFPGMVVNFLAASTNTGAATLNDNALGAVAIRRPDNTPLLPGDIIAGELVGVVWDGTLWRMTRWPEVDIRWDRRVASASAQIDIVLPAGFTRFRLEFDNVRLSIDGALLHLRTSIDGGATFAAGGTDYTQTLEATNAGASNVVSSQGSGPNITLCFGADNANAAVAVNGVTEFFIGDGTRQPVFETRASALDNSSGFLALHRGVGLRGLATAINAIRILPSSGTITIGTFRLIAVR